MLSDNRKINIREKTKEEIQEKLKTIYTPLSKIAYLEIALKQNLDIETKKFLWETISNLYELRAMYDKAGKAMSGKAGLEFTFKTKIDSYIKSAELYCKAGKPEEAEDMFVKSSRDTTLEQKEAIKFAMKNLFMLSAQNLEKQGKKVSALKFYEKLIKMKLDDLEKQEIKEKLIQTYKSLGKFREARLLEGI
jgi:tetratricopeptide (TPR) repeat protein